MADDGSLKDGDNNSEGGDNHKDMEAEIEEEEEGKNYTVQKTHTGQKKSPAGITFAHVFYPSVCAGGKERKTDELTRKRTRVLFYQVAFFASQNEISLRCSKGEGKTVEDNRDKLDQRECQKKCQNSSLCHVFINLLLGTE